MMVIDWLVHPHLNQKVNSLFTGNAKGDSTRLTEVCTRGCTVLVSGVKACEDRACGQRERSSTWPHTSIWSALER